MNRDTVAEENRGRFELGMGPRDLVLFDRGIIEGLTAARLPAVLLRASEDLVGENSVFDIFGTGDCRGGSTTSAGRDADTSSSSDLRTRFAGLVFSSRSEVVRFDLNGLAEASLPGNGGAIRPGVPFPAVRGRSGSSNPALEPLLFRDCAVGLE